MDTITHALAGGVIGYALKDRYGRTGLATVLAASLAPDADNVIRLFGTIPYLQWHRVLSNSLAGAAVLAVIVALLAKRFGRGVEFRTLLVLSFIGVGLHVFLDLTNSYGCKLLWPFSDRWYALDLVFIVDPWLTALLVLSLLVMRFGADKMGVLAGCFLLISAYWGMRYYERGRALDRFRAEKPEAAKIGAFPSALDPYSWHMVAEDEDWFHMGWYNLRTGRWFETETAAKEMENDGIKAALASDAGKVFTDFARFPYVSYDVLPNGWLVHIQDLRFSLHQGDRRFVLTVQVDKGGNVVSSEFNF